MLFAASRGNYMHIMHNSRHPMGPSKDATHARTLNICTLLENILTYSTGSRSSWIRIMNSARAATSFETPHAGPYRTVQIARVALSAYARLHHLLGTWMDNASAPCPLVVRIYGGSMRYDARLTYCTKIAHVVHVAISHMGPGTA